MCANRSVEMSSNTQGWLARNKRKGVIPIEP
jgi:hypothetical protein